MCAAQEYRVLETGMVLYVLFFFSSRRRHTRFDCDWSSDVCSSDLVEATCSTQSGGTLLRIRQSGHEDSPRWNRYRSEERRVGKSVDLGGRRIIKKKKNDKEREKK